MNNQEKLKEKLDDFLDTDQVNKEESKEEVHIQPKTGIVERIEKKLITDDGRQLLI